MGIIWFRWTAFDVANARTPFQLCAAVWGCRCIPIHHKSLRLSASLFSSRFLSHFEVIQGNSPQSIECRWIAVDIRIYIYMCINVHFFDKLLRIITKAAHALIHSSSFIRCAAHSDRLGRTLVCVLDFKVAVWAPRWLLQLITVCRQLVHSTRCTNEEVFPNAAFHSLNFFFFAFCFCYFTLQFFLLDIDQFIVGEYFSFCDW